jgi:hypothetical protein
MYFLERVRIWSINDQNLSNMASTNLFSEVYAVGFLYCFRHVSSFAIAYDNAHIASLIAHIHKDNRAGYIFNTYVQETKRYV